MGVTLPDIFLKRFKTVIFIHGCLWHGHGCNQGRIPKSNEDFWKEKIIRNVNRDEEVYKKLLKMKLNCIVVWTCWLRSMKRSSLILPQIKATLLKNLQLGEVTFVSLPKV